VYGVCADVPRSVWRVCDNPVYVCIVLGACSHVTLVGFATFLTKYLQAHFAVSAALASIYTGTRHHIYSLTLLFTYLFTYLLFTCLASAL